MDPSCVGTLGKPLSPFTLSVSFFKWIGSKHQCLSEGMFIGRTWTIWKLCAEESSFKIGIFDLQTFMVPFLGNTDELIVKALKTKLSV